jgi:hypothetical protein
VEKIFLERGNGGVKSGDFDCPSSFAQRIGNVAGETPLNADQ